MKAAVLTDDHRFDVTELDDPVPGDGELVLRVGACGICGSDLKAFHAFPAGTVMGHEFCGEVVAIGRDVEGWRAGEHVAALPVGACGRCRWCLADEPAHCERADYQGVGGSPGAFAEYVCVQAASAVRLPEPVGDLGALVEPLAVGLHTVEIGGLQPGERALVIGGGNVGAAVAVWASRLGAGEVIVSDPAPTRRDAAARFGATGVHDPAAGPLPGPFDVVFECAGAPGLLQSVVDATGVHGRVVIAGVHTAPESLLPVNALMKETEIRFAVYYRRREFAAAAEALASGEVDGNAFVSRRVGLDGMNDAFDTLLSTSTERKILVRP